MFEAIYEVRLAGRDVKIDMVCWDNIRSHIRDNKWFYLVYLGEKYKYVKDQPFYYRPTRFDFEKVDPNEDDTPDIIYVYPGN